MGTQKKTAAQRRARAAEMRRAEQARERRNRIITITTSAVVIAAMVAGGTYLLNKESAKKEQAEAAAKAPVKGERTWKKLGRNHVAKKVDYPMNPAAGGDHHQVWMNCDGDVYDKPLQDENAVHSLEHGAVWITYNDKAAKGDVEKLTDRVNRTPYTLMSPDPDQSGALTLTAWGRQITVDKASDARVEQFLAKYVQGKQTPEPGAVCTGGMGAAV